MATDKQVTIIKSFGFSEDYAKKLPHTPAKELIAQLHRISHLYYHSQLSRLGADVRESVARVGEPDTHQAVNSLSELAK